MISKTISRLAAIQVCYQFDMAKSEENAEDLNLEKFIFDIVEYYKINEDSANQESINFEHANINSKPNKNFIYKLSSSVFENLEKIDIIITKELEKEDSISKMNLLLKTILRCAVSEMFFDNTPTKVVIDEYVGLARDFFNNSEVNFTNAILDKISKNQDARI